MARRLTAQEKRDAALRAALDVSNADYRERPWTGRLGPGQDADGSPSWEALGDFIKHLKATPATVTAAWGQANKQFPRIEHGQRRKAGRPATPGNSNDPFITLLLTWYPDLLATPLTAARVAEIQQRLAAKRREIRPVPPPPHLRKREDDSLARAIRRAKQFK